MSSNSLKKIRLCTFARGKPAVSIDLCSPCMTLYQLYMQMVYVISYRFYPCRRRINLVLPIFFTFLIIVAAFTGQHFINHSLKVFTLENNLDWNRQVSEHTSSKFNLTAHTVHGESYGYVVAGSFSGQQGAGIQALISLQCWAASFSLPIRILEPLLSRYYFCVDCFCRNIGIQHFLGSVICLTFSTSIEFLHH